MKRARSLSLLPCCYLLVILSSCAGPASVTITHDQLSTEQVRQSSAKINVFWHRSGGQYGSYMVTGLLLKVTPSYLAMFAQGTVASAVGSYADPAVASTGTFIYTEIALDDIDRIELVMPHPARGIPHLMLLGASLLPLLYATPASAPHYIAYWSDTPEPGMALAPLIGGATLGSILGIVSSWAVKAGDQYELIRIASAARLYRPPEEIKPETDNKEPPVG
ncbi:hypothetical protein ACFL3X_01355 [Gemmatimonadota bacterium]